jgi:hypothetical protein
MYAITTNANGTTGWRAISSPDELLSGETLSDNQPSPTMADCASALKSDVQAWLDATASQNGYDSIASCISYAGSTIAQWSADAVAASKWRDAVWLACFQWQQSAAASPPTNFPTSAQVIAQLPQPEAFGWVTHAPGSTT